MGKKRDPRDRVVAAAVKRCGLECKEWELYQRRMHDPMTEWHNKMQMLVGQIQHAREVEHRAVEAYLNSGGS